jgi:hypothetical protein
MIDVSLHVLLLRVSLGQTIRRSFQAVMHVSGQHIRYQACACHALSLSGLQLARTLCNYGDQM